MSRSRAKLGRIKLQVAKHFIDLDPSEEGEKDKLLEESNLSKMDHFKDNIDLDFSKNLNTSLGFKEQTQEKSLILKDSIVSSP